MIPPLRFFAPILSTACWLLCSANAVTDTPMNVLFIISDDLRAETGAYEGMALTPNLDQLAARGVRFDRAYCQFPLCNPSRASMLTGRYATTTGVIGNRSWFGAEHPDWISLPKWFKQHGYQTLRAGKVFHGGIDDTLAWTEGGEQRHWGEGDRPEPEGNTVQPRGTRKDPPGLTKTQRSDRWIVLEGDGEDSGDYKVADLTVDYLQKCAKRDAPWMVFCGFSKPHSPPEAPQRFYDLYDVDSIPLTPDFATTPTVPDGFPAGSIRPQNADLFVGRESPPDEARKMIQAYLASCSWMDWNAGRVLQELERLGLQDHTIVVFWGDHGYQLGEKGKWSKAGSIWEQGCRVPFFIYDPRVKANGKVCPRIVQTLDIYPTLVELCGLAAPEGLEGLSLTPLLEDPQASWPHVGYTVWSEDGETLTGISVRTEDWHYAEFFGRGPGAMLLDPLKDPYEMKNLAYDPAYAKEVQELSALIRDHAAGFPTATHVTIP